MKFTGVSAAVMVVVLSASGCSREGEAPTPAGTPANPTQPKSPAPIPPAAPPPSTVGPSGGPASSSGSDAAVPAVDSVLAKPGLSVGDAAPDAELVDVNGKSVRLATLYKEGPVVVTFYRGEWCPFCNQALAGWESKLPELKAAGATIVAITPEKPLSAAKTTEKNALTYSVLTDPTQAAAKSFKVHFVMDEATKTKYEGYGLDLAAANASGTWELPAPGTFLIVPDGRGGGTVKYAFADWDYKKRADPDVVIAAVKEHGAGK